MSCAWIQTTPVCVYMHTLSSCFKWIQTAFITQIDGHKVETKTNGRATLYVVYL